MHQLLSIRAQMYQQGDGEMKSKIEVKQEERTIALQEIKTSIDRISELLDHISKLIDDTRDDVSDGDK